MTNNIISGVVRPRTKHLFIFFYYDFFLFCTLSPFLTQSHKILGNRMKIKIVYFWVAWMFLGFCSQQPSRLLKYMWHLRTVIAILCSRSRAKQMRRCLQRMPQLLAVRWAVAWNPRCTGGLCWLYDKSKGFFLALSNLDSPSNSWVGVEFPLENWSPSSQSVASAAIQSLKI